MFGGNSDPFDETKEETEDEFQRFEFEPLAIGEVSTEREAKKETCDHDSEHKEFITEQESRGASFGGFGGSFGTSSVKIGCKKCEKVYEVESEEDQSSPFF